MNKIVTKVKDNVDLVEIDGKKIYLVGTAHVSQASVALVEETIAEFKPDSVCIELCESRYKTLKDPDAWQKTDIVSVIKQGRSYVLLLQLFLASFQKRIGRHLDIKPGKEMMRAAELASENGARLVLADREIKKTLKRAWASIGLLKSVKIVGAFLDSAKGNGELKAEDIEKLKSSDMLQEAMQQFGNELPQLKQTIVDERDQYMAEQIQKACGPTIVAVLGAGHITGITQLIGTKIDLAPLEAEPPRGIITKITAWGVPFLFIALFAYGFIHAGAATSIDMIIVWALTTMLGTAIGAGLALAHPLAVLAGALMSPLTVLHPFLASGWFSGLTEAYLKKPTVADFQTVADDIMTIKGFWKNRLSHILLVIIMTNLGTFIASIIAIPAVTKQL